MWTGASPGCCRCLSPPLSTSETTELTLPSGGSLSVSLSLVLLCSFSLPRRLPLRPLLPSIHVTPLSPSSLPCFPPSVSFSLMPPGAGRLYLHVWGRRRSTQVGGHGESNPAAVERGVVGEGTSELAWVSGLVCLGLEQTGNTAAAAAAAGAGGSEGHSCKCRVNTTYWSS